MAKEKKKPEAKRPVKKKPAAKDTPARKAGKLPPEDTASSDNIAPQEEEVIQPEEASAEESTVKEDTAGQKPENQEDVETPDETPGESPDLSSEDANGEELPDGVEEAESLSHMSGNTFLRKLMDSNFIEYASYVIKERAIPDVDDGLKPVQRRILWALFKMEDGKFHKVANVIGDTMKYHPHGDASIGDALVVLANKEYYVEKQGNFGNILTGDVASAARYIECLLLLKRSFSTVILLSLLILMMEGTKNRYLFLLRYLHYSCLGLTGLPLVWLQRLCRTTSRSFLNHRLQFFVNRK